MNYRIVICLKTPLSDYFIKKVYYTLSKQQRLENKDNLPIYLNFLQIINIFILFFKINHKEY